jgi:hypothetical protein
LDRSTQRKNTAQLNELLLWRKTSKQKPVKTKVAGSLFTDCAIRAITLLQKDALGKIFYSKNSDAKD